MTPSVQDKKLPSIQIADNRANTQETVDLEDLATLFAQALYTEGISHQAEASLTLLDPEDIAQLKVQYLDGDGDPTDVLSFPIDGPHRPEQLPGGESSWMVGDLLICPQVAALQAPDHAGNLQDEMALLVIHGTLHLVGWDHVEQDQRQAMWQRERQLLADLYGQISRDPWSEADYLQALGTADETSHSVITP
ncbi:MAG: rRNA maturation RNase YbeY [Microthrixaceae bacterium]